MIRLPSTIKYPLSLHRPILVVLSSSRPFYSQVSRSFSIFIPFANSRPHSSSSSLLRPSKMSTHYDIIVLGSGQSGTPLASAFATAGRKTALVERSHIGGTCINEGCTPTKTMIASGRSAYLARRAGDYGVRVRFPGDITVEMETVRKRKRDIVSSWSQGGEAKLVKAGVDVIKGEGSFSGPKEVTVRMTADKTQTKQLSADIVVIDTGDRPAKPSIPGLEDVAPDRVLNSTSIMELGEVPAHLVVVGGGYIGLEFGQLFRRLGAKVTILQRGKQLAPREDEDVAEALLGIFEDDGIDVHLSAAVTSVRKSETGVAVRVKTKNGEGEDIEIDGSHILLAAGRTPNTDMLNLAAAGVKTGPRGHVLVNDRLETNVPGIYASGDVHGGPSFTHISYDDFRILRANILPASVPPTAPTMDTTSASTSRNLTPYVMYTDPQLGHVGLHVKEIQGREVKTATMPMAYVARAIETDETRGLMKATVDAKTGEILGFTCLGIEGGELMAIMQVAIMGGLKWWDLEAAVFSHPSLAESLNNLWGYLK